MFEENNKVINKNCEKNRGNQNSVKFNIQLKEDTSNNNNINLIKNLKEINEFDNCPTDNIIEKNKNYRKTNLHIYQITLGNNREINNVNQLKYLNIKENVLLEISLLFPSII